MSAGTSDESGDSYGFTEMSDGSVVVFSWDKDHAWVQSDTTVKDLGIERDDAAR